MNGWPKPQADERPLAVKPPPSRVVNIAASFVVVGTAGATVIVVLALALKFWGWVL